MPAAPPNAARSETGGQKGRAIRIGCRPSPHAVCRDCRRHLVGLEIPSETALPVCASLYFIAAEWLVPSLDGTGFPYSVFLLLYAAFLADKAIIYAHKTRLLRK